MADDGIVFDGYRPGAIAAVIALHMAYYGPRWGFGAAFDTRLAREMGEFHVRRDATADLFLGAWDRAGALLGSVTVDGGDPAGAHLRWFIVADAARGRGLGNALMRQAMAFVDARGHAAAWLTTLKGLDAARAL